MIAEYRLGSLFARHDPDETKRAYDRLSVGAADGCPCDGCLNLIEQRPAGYPAELLALFDALGIHPAREQGSYHDVIDTWAPTYELWFPFHGAPGPECAGGVEEELAEGVLISVQRAKRGRQTLFTGRSVAILRVRITLPWVLSSV